MVLRESGDFQIVAREGALIGEIDGLQQLAGGVDNMYRTVE